MLWGPNLEPTVLGIFHSSFDFTLQKNDMSPSDTKNECLSTYSCEIFLYDLSLAGSDKLCTAFIGP